MCVSLPEERLKSLAVARYDSDADCWGSNHLEGKFAYANKLERAPPTIHFQDNPLIEDKAMT